MVNLLANVVEVTGPGGEHVVVDPMGPMFMSAVFLFLILMPLIIILLFFFYKKKLQHQQILAAMEKGLPVKDLLEPPKPPKKRGTAWVANISAGIGLLFIAIASMVVYKITHIFEDAEPVGVLILLAIPIIFAGFGITRLLRGLFQKAELKKKPVVENDEDEEIETPPPALPVE